MKKWMSLFLVLTLACSLLACGNQSEPTDHAESTPQGNTAETSESISSSQIVAPDHIQKAIDISNRLTTSSLFLAEDGSILVYPGFGNWHNGIREDLRAVAKIPNLKKIVTNGKDTEILALTEEGDVYYNGTLLLSGVVDMDYNKISMVINQMPNNAFIREDMAGALYFVLDEDLQTSYHQSWVQQAPDRLIDVDGQIVRRHEYPLSDFMNISEKNGTTYAEALKYIVNEERDYLALGEDGKLYIKELSRDDELNYDKMDCYDWENLVWVDSAEYDRQFYEDYALTLTVAGIQADGTVVACGEYADEILSWGQLSYLSMREGLIAGLTPDGTVRLTGQRSEELKAEVESWTDIAGIQVGKLNQARTDVISAITTDGSFRICFYSGEQYGIINVYFSLTDPSGGHYYRYSPDGNVYESNAETGEWEIWTPES